MELPVICGKCGTTSVGGLIIPAGTTASLRAEKIKTDQLSVRHNQVCPVCHSLISRESIDLTLEVTSALLQSKSAGADLRSIAESLRELVNSKSGETQVDSVLAQGKWEPLRRLLPKGQANVLAFCALVIAIATFLENILANFVIQQNQTPSSRAYVNSLDLRSAEIKLEISA
jgi:hypothetical protein